MNKIWKDKTILLLGADGYIGYPLALRCVTNGAFVIGVDSGHRRSCVSKMNSVSATKLSSIYEREEILNHIGDYHPYDCDVMDDRVTGLIKSHKPDVIVNLAHDASAPWSMKSKELAQNVLSNNILNTNKLLWDIHTHCPDAHYITIGSTGEYNHTINVDIEEGYFSFEHNGRESKQCLFPREANSIYHACYDDKTEVLTQDGWKWFKDITGYDLITTLNKETDTLEYQYPSNIFDYDYDGVLININNRSIDINVTPNHNIFTHTVYTSDCKNWRMESAENIYNKNRCIRRSVSNWNGDKCYITLPECKVKVNGHSSKTMPELKIDAVDFIDFFGWWITEGSLYNRYVHISQQKECNFDDIINSFDSLNLNRKITTNNTPSRGGIVGFMISHPQLSQYLKQFGQSKDKFIPKELKNLPKHLLKRLLGVMIKGDGHLKDDHYKMAAAFYTISKQLADDIQEICLKCGYVAIINEVDRKGNGYIEYNINITDNLSTQLIMSESVSSQRQNPIYSKNQYSGKVYCCEVPNSIIYVRRNGKPCWCGNSKIGSTYLIDYLTRLWGLRCTDIMQSVVFGLYTPECDQWKDWSRLDSDDAFGTVIHRFVVQSLLGEPMTVYGHGKHQRAFLSLNDSIQALEIAINNPAEQGKVQSWNQLTEWHSIEDVAKSVSSVIKDAVTETIPSPRKEFTGGHYYNYKSDILKNLGYKPTRTIEQEIQYIVDTLKLDSRKKEILRKVIKPQVQF